MSRKRAGEAYRRAAAAGILPVLAVLSLLLTGTDGAGDVSSSQADARLGAGVTGEGPLVDRSEKAGPGPPSDPPPLPLLLVAILAGATAAANLGLAAWERNGRGRKADRGRRAGCRCLDELPPHPLLAEGEYASPGQALGGGN